MTILNTLQPPQQRELARLMLAVSLCEAINTDALLAGVPDDLPDRTTMVDLIIHVDRLKRRYERVSAKSRARLATPRTVSRVKLAHGILES